MKDDALKVRWIEGVHGRGAQRGHRDSHLHPPAGGEVTRVFAEWFGDSEAARKGRDLESFAGVGQNEIGKVSGRDGLWRVEPEIQVAAGELGNAIAEIDQVDLGVPAA